MASPNTTFTSGAILTAAQMNNLPFGLMGFVENTSLSQTGITTVTDITGMTITFTGIASRRYRVDGNLLLQSTVNADTVNLIIRNGSNTTLQQAIYALPISTSSYMCAVSLVFATTGSTTIKLSVQRQDGTGTMKAAGGGTFPAQLTITDIGSV